MISSITDIIDDARNGLPFILVDAEDRENEGDIVIPAQFATPAQINFMAKHARGLICLAMTRERADFLRLSPMAARNQAALGTAFTVSIEAREGVSTGISAHDRAHTVSVAIDPTKTASDIVSPGHVFPLISRDGGVLVRAGHTEAAVDIARMAGLIPSGVICEIMNEDGSMARLPDLIRFAETHKLKIGTIADLIAFRRANENFIERVETLSVESRFGGKFELIVYRSKIDQVEHVVLVSGMVDKKNPTLVRMHQVDFAIDSLGIIGARENYIDRAMTMLAEHNGAGVAVFIRDNNPQWKSQRYEDQTHEAHKIAIKDYGIGAQILTDLGVNEIILLSSSQHKLTALNGYGLRIIDQKSIT